MLRRHALTTPRRGFTIVEVLVALLLATVGLLAVAGAETLAWRRRAAADREVRASEVTRNRVESIAGGNCAAAAGGSNTRTDGIIERWSVTRQGRALLIDARADWPTASGGDSVTLAGSRWCE